VSALRLVLARHGRTESNVLRKLDSLPPGPPLDDVGREQAEDLAEKLSSEPVVAVYSSMAVRARQTAAPIARRHGLDVRIVDGLHEVSCGDYEGSNTLADIEAFLGVYRSWHEGDLDRPVPGGDSGRQVLDRFLPAVTRLGAEHADGVAVLVSHGAVLRLVAHALSNVDGAFADAHHLPNCATITLEADGDGWRCLTWAGLTPLQQPPSPGPPHQGRRGAYPQATGATLRTSAAAVPAPACTETPNSPT
jgi:probable phosphoglycerate mutase